MIVNVKEFYLEVRHHPTRPLRWSNQSKKTTTILVMTMRMNLEMMERLYATLKETGVSWVNQEVIAEGLRVTSLKESPFNFEFTVLEQKS